MSRKIYNRLSLMAVSWLDESTLRRRDSPSGPHEQWLGVSLPHHQHGERRRSGRKILTQDFEILPPAAALATNLHHADYVSLVCGSLDRLPEAFAALDAPHRSRSIAVGAKQNSTTVETASLSAIDKRFVRRQIFEEYILDAAKCA